MLEDKQGLPNKYRPRTFEEYIGNRSALSVLQAQVFGQAVESRYHSILIQGPMGAGKSTLAELIAQVLTQGNEAGIIRRNVSSNNTADDARALEEELNGSSILASNRVFIFEEAHRLTTAAADILLTSIEHLPADTYCIFVTTEPEGLRPTLRDRLLPVKLTPLAPPEIEQLINLVIAGEGYHLTDGCKQLLVETYIGSNRNLIKNIGLLNGCKNVLEAKELLSVEEAKDAEGDVIEAVKLILSPNNNADGPAQFQQALNRCYDKIKNNPESARLAAGSYITKCMLSNPRNASFMMVLGPIIGELGAGQFTYPNAHLKLISILIYAYAAMRSTAQGGYRG